MRRDVAVVSNRHALMNDSGLAVGNRRHGRSIHLQRSFTRSTFAPSMRSFSSMCS